MLTFSIDNPTFPASYFKKLLFLYQGIQSVLQQRMRASRNCGRGNHITFLKARLRCNPPNYSLYVSKGNTRIILSNTCHAIGLECKSAHHIRGFFLFTDCVPARRWLLLLQYKIKGLYILNWDHVIGIPLLTASDSWCAELSLCLGDCSAWVYYTDQLDLSKN